MRCTKARKLIGRAVPDGLPEDLATALESHLDDCADCAAHRSELTRVWEALEAYPTLEVSPDFVERARARLREDSGADTPDFGSPWHPRLGWQWMTVAASLLLGVSLILTSGPGPRRGGPEVIGGADGWDNKFLQDLEQSLSRSGSNYLPVYDSWPGTLLEGPGSEPAEGPKVNKSEEKG